VLPIDNAVPLIVADAVEATIRPLPDPLYAGWSASDRPPLQSGIYLAMLPVGNDAHGIHYAVISSLLQSLWILGVWALLAAARTDRAQASVALAAIVFSGFVIVNSFFVWPKLLSAAFLLPIVAATMTVGRSAMLASPVISVILGLDLGGALLAHAGAALGFLAIVLALLIRRLLPRLRMIAAIICWALILVGPWIYYQKFVNPPGDRLLRLSIAGIDYTDTRKPLIDATIDNYRNVGGWVSLENKVDNLMEPFEGIDVTMRESFKLVRSYLGVGDHEDRGAAVLRLRTEQFFHLVPALGLLALGPILLGASSLLARIRGRPRVANGQAVLRSSLLVLLGVNLVTWAAVMFGPSGTVLHQGTYLTPILGFIVCVSAWWCLSPRVTLAVVAVQSVITLLLYKNFPPSGPQPFFVPHVSLSALATAAIGLAATVAVLVRLGRNPSASKDDLVLL
jgi:hypothetical protein